VDHASAAAPAPTAPVATMAAPGHPATTPGGHPGGHPGGDPGGHPGAIPGAGSVRPTGYVFDRAPMMLYWEMTRSCGLVCRHCRAEANAERHPDELTTAEGEALLDKVLGFGSPMPHVVFTGGDPLRRPDLADLVRAARARGIGASLAPAATPELTRDALFRLRDAGVQNISLSLDGSNAARHDGFRGVEGTFDLTVKAAGWAQEAGLPVQLNTLVTNETLDDLPAIHDLCPSLGIMRWSLFFLISVGRGTDLQEISPAESEKLMAWLLEIGKTAPFQVKTTEATHYRRIAIRTMHDRGMSDEEIAQTSIGRGFGIRDGNGIMFVNFDGDIYPSGFLPVAAGNVRRDDIVEVYRDSYLFRSLRDVKAFKGRCGRCEYGALCGGSRARAFTWTGDPLESDPLCPYAPPVPEPAVAAAAGAPAAAPAQ
jgi:radical SAM protein